MQYGTVISKTYLKFMSKRFQTSCHFKDQTNWPVKFLLYHTAGRETVQEFMIDAHSLSHYNINNQSRHMKTLEHVSACRHMFAPFFSEGHLQNFSRSGFVLSIVCIHILYACIFLYMCPSWKLVLWNCVRACEIDCGAAAGLLSPYFIEIDLTGHCSMRSIMASIPKPFDVILPPTQRSD